MTADDLEHQGKADFDHVYNRADPRQYYRTLRPLGYEIPHNANDVFEALLKARARRSPGDAGGSVLDVCCSYGVNAALLRYDISLDKLFDRYNDPALAGLSTTELAAADRSFYGDRQRPGAPRVLGLDVAGQAVDYATSVGLLDAGWAEDLESAEPSPDLRKELAEVGLVVVTGGVGYVTELTFDRLASALDAQHRPWIAAFVLRMYSYDSISETLAGHGLVTEQLTGTTFRQRRFDSRAEETAAVEAVRDRQLDTAGKEDDGWYHCDFFLSRPAEDVEACSLADLLAGQR